MSLREQLLKAGLVSADKIKQAERDKRKHSHQAKKDKSVAAAEQARKAEAESRRAEVERQKREQDRELNRQREQARNRKAVLARVRQLIDSNRQNDPEAEQLYNFQDGRKIRRVRATPQQQKLLALGRLGIARNPHDPFDFPIVPRAAALKLQKLSDEHVVLLFEESARLEEDDDWPADW